MGRCRGRFPQLVLVPIETARAALPESQSDKEKFVRTSMLPLQQ